MTFGFKEPLERVINKVRNNHLISIKEKETACAIENLLLYCINGNPRSLNHSFFSATKIRLNIDLYSFPYTDIDIDLDTMETELSEDYYCKVKLLQQQMNPMVRNSDTYRITNELNYRLERLDYDKESVGFQIDMILKLLERLFRRDIANIFKKRLLKSAIDQDIKYKLLQKEPEYAFFEELERQVSINKVLEN